MMNLNYLNQDEVKRMAGEPAHSITNHPREGNGELVLEFKQGSKTPSNKKKSLVKEGHSDSCLQRLVIPIDNNIKSAWDIVVLILIAYSCFTTTY